jgi:hypothetical protein
MQYPVFFKPRSIAEFHTSTPSLKQDRDTHCTSVEQEAKNVLQLVVVRREKEQRLIATEHH